MPELPEVETTANKLKSLLIGKAILDFDKNILGVERRGKAILFWLSGNYILGFHQRMSGKLLIVDRDFCDKHIRKRFKLSDGKDLAFHDVRRFGVVWYGTAKKVLEDNYFKTLGADALTVSFRDFKKILKFSNPPSPPYSKGGTRGRGIKSFLLDQKNIAGIGNIMADEILWQAKIHPERKTTGLSVAEIKKLYKSIKFILNKSIKLGGSSMRDWLHPDGEKGGYFEKRYVYGREGEKCPRCDEGIIKERIAGRGTYFCQNCQKK